MNHISKFNFSMILIALFSYYLLNSCQLLQPSQPPIAVALLYEVPMSVEESAGPVLDKVSVSRLFALLKERTGVLVFCEISSQERLLPIRRNRHEPILNTADNRVSINICNGLDSVNIRNSIRRILVFVNGMQNETGSMLMSPPPDKVVVTIGVSDKLAQELFGPDAHIFQSVQAAIAYINSASD